MKQGLFVVIALIASIFLQVTVGGLFGLSNNLLVGLGFFVAVYLLLEKSF